jgi:hypothetical protein
MLRAIISLTVLASSFALAGCGETPEVHYPTYEAAVSAGAILRGWIPAFLPKSAVAIHEIHDIDTNKSMLAFRFNGSEKIELGSGCERIDPFKPAKTPFKVSWWPSDVPASKLSTYRHSFYSCEGGEAFLALSEKPGEGFYWRP